MSKGIFITGTDTGVGKTLVSTALLSLLNQAGLRTAAMKPVASGSELTDEGLRNADALALRAAATVSVNYEITNPYAFAPPIAPHLAAQLVGVSIDLEKIKAGYGALARQADVVIVEGAGGWRVPLGGGQFLSDLAEQLQLDVILVVGLRLGCLNHASLTAEAILRGGRSKLLAWVGNQIDPGYALIDENIAALKTLLPCPCLGVLRWTADPRTETAAAQLDLQAILTALAG